MIHDLIGLGGLYTGVVKRVLTAQERKRIKAQQHADSSLRTDLKVRACSSVDTCLPCFIAPSYLNQYRRSLLHCACLSFSPRVTDALRAST
jgi:hypothetical protein